MKAFPASPQEMLTSVWRHRGLIRSLVVREVAGRYRGSLFGILWSFFNPIFMLAVYTFFFSVVFRVRWQGGGESKAEFALVLFAGLIVFNFFAECVTRAPSLVLSNPNYVKRVAFPLEVLPWVGLGAAAFHLGASLVVWLVAYALLIGVPHASFLYLPLVVVPLSLLILGLSWVLASLGVYLRDVAQVVGVATTALMFLSPIFYAAEALPEQYRVLLMLNPLTPAVEQTRALLYWGTGPDLTLLAAYLAGTAVAAWLGFAWFQRTRKGFADVL
jgi:lipopolysaccharide transport system permease protein